MDVKFYIRARQKGLKAYSQAIQQHQDPYLPVLEEKVPTLNSLERVTLGIQTVPLERVCGSVSRGRSFAFANNFMPILETNSEFCGKWSVLYESVEAEGLRDPVKVLEYLGYYYLIEGNKRVSVMKFLGGDYLEADVTRVVPPRSDAPEVVAYFEYCAFAKITGIYDIFFTRPGSYDRLSALPGMKSGETWSQDDTMTLRKLYRYFHSAYRTVMQEQPSLPCGDAFLRWLLAFGYQDVRDLSLSDVEKNLRLMQQEFRLREDAMNIVMEHTDRDPSLLQSLFHPSHIKAAFLYTRPIEGSAWNYWHDLGRLEAQEKLGSRVETVNRIVPSRAEAEAEIEKLIKDGFNVIFATSPVMLNSCVEPALKHPDTRFLVSSQLAGYHQVHTYYLRFYQAKFLLGVLAGILSKNGKIGYIADYPIYGTPSMINAFAIGARMVQPEAKIYLNWTSLTSFDQQEPFHDPEIQVVCNRDLTAPNRDSRESGLYVRDGGEIRSMAALIPRWGIFYRHVMEQMLKGVFDNPADSNSSSRSYWWGIASDTLDIAFSSRCAPGPVRLVRNLQEQFRDQAFTPFEGELRDQQGRIRCQSDQRLTPAEILCMDYLADCVVGSLPSPEELVPSARSLVMTQGIGSLAEADVDSISWTFPQKKGGQ